MRSMYAGFSKLAQGGDVQQYVAAHYDPGCEYEPAEESESVRGHEALVAWNERWFEAWEEFHAEIDELIEEGDIVVTGITVRGRGSESGLEIDQRIFHVSELRESKILRMREFLDRHEALEAVGLSE